MSDIIILLPKLPLRKCSLHSKFSGSLQSSHSVSWNCSPSQYFDYFKITWSNQGWEFLPWGTMVHLIETFFRYANCYFSSNSTTWMWCNFKLWSLHSVREWNTHIDLALLRFRSQSLLNLAITSFMCQIMPLCVASFLITSWLFGMWNNYFIS
jgi:hypothetical protein